MLKLSNVLQVLKLCRTSQLHIFYFNFLLLSSFVNCLIHFLRKNCICLFILCFYHKKCLKKSLSLMCNKMYSNLLSILLLRNG